MKRDYYEILGVSRDADEEEIKRAYKRLAMRYHPDRNPGNPQAAEKMKEVNEAYAVLSDPEKRRLYDLYGHRGLEGYTYDDLVAGVDFGSLLEELFGSFFGGSLFESLFGGLGRERSSRRIHARRRGRDIRMELEITLEEAAFGARKKVTVVRSEPCPRCRGSGAEKMERCPECGGSGQIVLEQRSGWAYFRQIRPCHRCQGSGLIVRKVCQLCQGSGVREAEKEVLVTIPPGVDSGQVIKLEGGGEAWEGEYPGDLYLVLKLKPHPIFKRKGYDIWVEKAIPFTLAALGGRVYGIPSLEGELQVEIPPGARSGTVLQIEGKGIPYPSGEGRGSEFVKIEVIIPDNLSPEEISLLQQFEGLRASALDPLFISQRRFGLLALPPAKEEEDGGATRQTGEA